MVRVVTLIIGIILFSQMCVGAEFEQTIGKLVAEELEDELGVVRDPLLVRWVEDLGRGLAGVCGRQDISYSFKILDTDEINAFGCPGGYIYVTKGMLRFVGSEDELAGVMGHEIGHSVICLVRLWNVIGGLLWLNLIMWRRIYRWG